MTKIPSTKQQAQQRLAMNNGILICCCQMSQMVNYIVMESNLTPWITYVIYTKVFTNHAHYPMEIWYNLILSKSKQWFLKHSIDIVYFSKYPSSDICYDYSYWNDSNKCYNGKDVENYTHARLCSTYNNTMKKFSNDCTKKSFGKSNCSNSCEEKGHTYYYCEVSEKCIEKIKLCDGIIHCLYGEDEGEGALNHCKNKFSQIASVKCIKYESGGYNFWMYSIPCSNQCKNGDDAYWYCNIFLVSKYIIIKQSC